MKKIRKKNTAKRKKDLKEAEERLGAIGSLMMKHPTDCFMCRTEFERTQETVKTWHVIVREETVRLACPACWKNLNEMREKIEELRGEAKNEN